MEEQIVLHPMRFFRIRGKGPQQKVVSVDMIRFAEGPNRFEDATMKEEIGCGGEEISGNQCGDQVVVFEVFIFEPLELCQPRRASVGPGFSALGDEFEVGTEENGLVGLSDCMTVFQSF